MWQLKLVCYHKNKVSSSISYIMDMKDAKIATNALRYKMKKENT